MATEIRRRARAKASAPSASSRALHEQTQASGSSGSPGEGPAAKRAKGSKGRPKKGSLPQGEFPLLPLRGMLIFPGMVHSLEVGRPRSIAALEAAVMQDRRLVLAAQRQAQTNDPSPEEIYGVGTLAEVKQVMKLPGGEIRVLVEGIARVRIEQYLQEEPHYRVRAQLLEPPVEGRPVHSPGEPQARPQSQPQGQPRSRPQGQPDSLREEGASAGPWAEGAQGGPGDSDAQVGMPGDAGAGRQGGDLPVPAQGLPVGGPEVPQSQGRGPKQSLELQALVRTVLRDFEQYVKLGNKAPLEVMLPLTAIDDPGRLADTIVPQVQVPLEDKQAVLEAVDPKARLERLVALLGREIEILDMERRIHLRVRRQMEKSQKEYYLREQIRAIQKELGERDERQAEIEEIRSRIEAARMPKQAREKAEHELARLEKMPPAAAEAVVVRTYLDWLVSLPWSRKTRDRLDVRRAAQILDEDHYGLDKVKERILEFLAVRQLAERLKGPILCLVGPPGVGKTSLARSVARALERKFVRFSLGGLRDEAEIRGHRRTYVGALPGKIIQAMRQAGTKNPVLLLDEIDKMSFDFRGDPSAALLEVLDPEQNHQFGDHYLEVPFDLSDVLFITTGNVLQAIPRPLRDRMEVIAIPGYTEEEKVQIAVRHLIPKLRKDHGLKEEQLQISTKAVGSVITGYTREAGVRNLERNLAALCRKAARQVVEDPSKTVRVTPGSLHRLLGPRQFTDSITEQEDRVGLATGLAYTEVGGDLLTIEVSAVKGKGHLTLTGKLGEVMRESAQAGYSYVRSRAAALGIDPDFPEKLDIHVHVPEGAIPKDGPSAGITMATALASVLSGRPVRRDVAMTGEITLRGRVLPIGGLKEKILAAHRYGIRTVIIPAENRKDLEEIPANVRRRMRIVPVDHMDDVLRIALRALPQRPAAVHPEEVPGAQNGAGEGTRPSGEGRNPAEVPAFVPPPDAGGGDPEEAPPWVNEEIH